MGIATKEELREKRYQVLKATWNLMIENGYINPERFIFSKPLIDEVVEHYLDDLTILKKRYNIPGEAQLHKVAGLMASAILRYRPIVPIVDTLENQHEVYANEFFSVLHGLATCGEFSLKVCEEVANETWFDSWVDNFVFLMHRRNHTPESLAFIFETLSVFLFPANFKVR